MSNPCIATKDEIIGMLDAGGDIPDNEPIEEVENVQISDLVVDRVKIKYAKSALVTLNNFLEQRHVDVTPFM